MSQHATGPEDTPLRVAHLLSGDLWAGAEAATFHLLCALARRPDVRPEAILLNEGLLARRLEAAGIPFSVEAESRHSFASLLRAVRARARGCDLVHAHRYKENLLAALSGRPWVTTQHGRPEPFRGLAAARMRAYRAIDAVAKRLSARRVIAVSEEVEAYAARRAGARRTVRVWNGIDDPAAGIEVPSWETRPLRVGALGRLHPVKAYELAIDTVAACPALELEIAGEGPERAALEARAAASGAADRIRLLGHVDDPRPLLASWRALLVTSRHEGNPIGVLEALALGTPVLAARLPGVAEILDADLVEGHGGWIEATRDPEAWAGRLTRLLDCEADGVAASRAARRRYEAAFTADAAAERTLGVYRDALATGAEQGRPGDD